jgi:hypothetical protein
MINSVPIRNSVIGNSAENQRALNRKGMGVNEEIVYI